jgi:hypothetical protein
MRFPTLPRDTGALAPDTPMRRATRSATEKDEEMTKRTALFAALALMAATVPTYWTAARLRRHRRSMARRQHKLPHAIRAYGFDGALDEVLDYREPVR